MTDQALIQSVERLARRAELWFDRSRAALVGELPCQAGCHRCCIGTFSVTILDRRFIQRRLATLPVEAQQQIEQRASVQATSMEAAFPCLSQSPYLDGWTERDLDELGKRFEDAPCPALDHDGCCQVYEHRPLTCRLMGLPTEAGGMTHPACEVQVAVPLVRLSSAARVQLDDIINQEGTLLEQTRPPAVRSTNEEIPLPYAFLRHSPWLDTVKDPVVR